MVKNLINFSIVLKDIIIAGICVVLLTLQPSFANGPLNLFELGLYLPPIDAILHGQTPYRDFFYLRGPFEIYVPALMMKIWGVHTVVLAFFFYAGNVLCLGLACLIAAEFLKTRLMFYVFIPAVIARCFPRVVFPYWGGLRYVMGLLFVYVFIRAIKTNKNFLYSLAGFIAGMAIMTSIEVGVCCAAASLAFFVVKAFMGKEQTKGMAEQALTHAAGYAIGLLPWIIFFICTGAFIPFIEAVEAVVFKSHPTFMTHLTSSSPKSAVDFAASMLPGMKNFKYMTPMYAFMALGIWLGWSWLKGKFTQAHLGLVIVWAYGFVLYTSAFRIIEGGQFETALQVEKIIFFYMVEIAVLALWARQNTLRINWQKVTSIFLVILLVSSWGYAFSRAFKRFPVFASVRAQFDAKYRHKLEMKQQDMATLTMPRAKGVKTSKEQAQELEEVYAIVKAKTLPEDKIFVYPDMGAYYFLNERLPVGKFSIATLSWMKPNWHEGLMNQLNIQKPKLIIVKKRLEPDFENVYFKRPQNAQYFKDISMYISTHYKFYADTPKSFIYILET